MALNRHQRRSARSQIVTVTKTPIEGSTAFKWHVEGPNGVNPKNVEEATVPQYVKDEMLAAFLKRFYARWDVPRGLWLMGEAFK